MNNLLVIEDNPADVSAIRLLLDQAGFKHTLYQADSLAEGKKIIHEKPVDLVLLDLSLEDSMGFSTLKNYLQSVPAIPVIVLTGNNNHVLGDQSVKAGAQDYLIKGEFTSKRLVESIRFGIQRFRSQYALKEKINALSHSERRLQEVQQIGRFGNWEMDIVSNSMKWSEEVFRIFGIYRNSIQPRLSDYLERVHPEDIPIVEQFFDKVVKEDAPMQLAHRIFFNGRSIKYLEVQARLQFDEQLNKIMLIGTVHDITHLKKNGSAGINHIMPTPEDNALPVSLTRQHLEAQLEMASLISALSTWETSNGNPDPGAILDIKNATQRLSAQLNIISNLAFHAEKSPKPVFGLLDFEALINQTFQVFKFRLSQSEIDVQFKVNKEFPNRLYGDIQKIWQILHNVLEIILLRGRKNSQVDVAISVREIRYPQCQFTASITYKEGALAKGLKYQSNGEDSAVLMFMEATEKFLKGVNGSWSTQKKAGNKTNIELIIPLGTAAGYTTIERPNFPIRVLLADDHSMAQIALKKTLHSWSNEVEVAVADDGAQAIDLFSKQPFDIALFDIYMPVLSGLQAAQEIRKNSKIPIIALTSNPSKQEEDRCKKSGINAYLIKPPNPEELFSKILELI